MLTKEMEAKLVQLKKQYTNVKNDLQVKVFKGMVIMKKTGDATQLIKDLAALNKPSGKAPFEIRDNANKLYNLINSTKTQYNQFRRHKAAWIPKFKTSLYYYALKNGDLSKTMYLAYKYSAKYEPGAIRGLLRYQQMAYIPERFSVKELWAK